MSLIPKRKDSDCIECPLFKEKAVWGAGRPVSTVAVVSDSPKEKNVKTGSPSGDKFFNSNLSYNLKKAGISERDVYRTFAIKCMPPKNIPPNSAKMNIAILKCRGKLEKELGLLNPDIIIGFGDVTLRTLTGDKGISKHRGGIIDTIIGDIKGLFTYSVYALMSNKGAKYAALIEKDVVLAGKYLVGDEAEGVVATKYSVLDTMPKIRAFFTKIGSFKKKAIAMDTETTVWLPLKDKILMKDGALSYAHAKFLCWGFSWTAGQAYVIPIRGFRARHIWTLKEKKEIFKLMKEVLEMDFLTWIFQNIMYDLRLLHRICKVNIWKVNWEDTMLMQHVLNEDAPLDLDGMADTRTNMGSYKTELNKKYKGIKAEDYGEF